MHIVNEPKDQEVFFSTLARRTLALRVLTVVLVAVALVVSAAGTAFAIGALSGADSGVEGY